jgi:uncharacterized membrane protein
MRLRVKEANLHRLFEITLVLKGLDSLLEIISGALLAGLSTAVMRGWAWAYPAFMTALVRRRHQGPYI